jgi:hypothetical protein
MVRLSISYIYSYGTHKIIYKQIYCAGNDEVIFEQDTSDEYMFYGQGMPNTI